MWMLYLSLLTNSGLSKFRGVVKKRKLFDFASAFGHQSEYVNLCCNTTYWTHRVTRLCQYSKIHLPWKWWLWEHPQTMCCVSGRTGLASQSYWFCFSSHAWSWNNKNTRSFTATATFRRQVACDIETTASSILPLVSLPCLRPLKTLVHFLAFIRISWRLESTKLSEDFILLHLVTEAPTAPFLSCSTIIRFLDSCSWIRMTFSWPFTMKYPPVCKRHTIK